MKKTKLTTLIAENAKTLSELFKAIDSTEEGKKAAERFHASYDLLAFPGGLAHGLELLKQQDDTTINHAIEYLGADPYFHRSGYIKAKIAHLLKQADLSQEQVQQLQPILLSSIQQTNRREFQDYCRLAAKVANTPFLGQVQAIIDHSDDERVVARARLMADAISKKPYT